MGRDAPLGLQARVDRFDVLPHRERMEVGRALRRKNTVAHGVCRASLRGSADAWHRTMAWIDTLADVLPDDAG